MTIADSTVQINSKFAPNQVVDDVLHKLKKQFLKKDIEKIARDTKFIQRSSSKLSGFNFLTSFLILSGGAHSTLERMSETVTYVSHKVKISAQGLMKRINQEKSTLFLKSIFSKMIKERILDLQDPPAELLASFSKVLLQDSTTVNLHEKLQKDFKGSGGRASKACVKFDVTYDWKRKDYEQITLTDRSEADQKLGLNIDIFVTEGALVIRDLGYLRMDGLVRIIAKKAFFLSRLRSSMLVYLNQEDEYPTDMADHIVKNHLNEIDLQVYITAEKVPVRLVMHKVPEAVANERRRKAKATAKKEGRQLQKKTLKFMDYNLFITNVPKEVWRPEVIGTIYRIRWQIELIFKCWKSKMEIHYLKGINPERIKCLIYAKLILILLINQVYKLVEFICNNFLDRVASMYKVFAWMQNPERLMKIIKGNLEGWERRAIVQTISKIMCMQKRKRKTTLESMSEGEFYYQLSS